MSKTIEIEVTRENAMQGKRSMPYACPVALASRRAFSSPVRVALDNVTVMTPDSAMVYSNPLKLMEAISRYDMGADFPPGRYTLTEV